MIKRHSKREYEFDRDGNLVGWIETGPLRVTAYQAAVERAQLKAMLRANGAGQLVEEAERREKNKKPTILHLTGIKRSKVIEKIRDRQHGQESITRRKQNKV